MSDRGYAQIRRGLQEHVVDGRMTIMEYGVYVWLIQCANPSTGIWMGSAKLLAIQVSIPDRNARYFLESLEKKGYIKRFPVLRRKTNYPILISRFHCSLGAHKGMMVNASLSMTSTTIVYESLPTDCPPTVTEVPQTTAHASPLKTLETLDFKKEEKGNLSDAGGVKGPPQNGGAASNDPPEILETLGVNELKGLRTTLLRTIRDKRMPGNFRASMKSRLEIVEQRLKSRGVA